MFSAMNTLLLPKQAWKSYFEAMSDVLIGKWAEVEVAALDLGDQIVAERLPLLGITYDTKDDLVDVSLGGENQLNHLIRNPSQIVIAEGVDGLRSIAITSGDGTVQVLRLRDPLRLPQATPGSQAVPRGSDRRRGARGGMN
jgi:hypothetical protein